MSATTLLDQSADCAPPSTSRQPNSQANEPPNGVTIIISDHSALVPNSTRRDPKRSAARPAGIWPIA
nr:hypothetical protein [Burkholderia arboris]